MPASIDELELSKDEISRLRRFVLYMLAPGVRVEMITAIADADSKLDYIGASKKFDDLRAELEIAKQEVMTDAEFIEFIIERSPQLSILRHYANTRARLPGMPSLILDQAIPGEVLLTTLVDCFHTMISDEAKGLTTSTEAPPAELEPDRSRLSGLVSRPDENPTDR